MFGDQGEYCGEIECQSNAKNAGILKIPGSSIRRWARMRVWFECCGGLDEIKPCLVLTVGWPVVARYVWGGSDGLARLVNLAAVRLVVDCDASSVAETVLARREAGAAFLWTLGSDLSALGTVCFAGCVEVSTCVAYEDEFIKVGERVEIFGSELPDLSRFRKTGLDKARERIDAASEIFGQHCRRWSRDATQGLSRLFVAPEYFEEFDATEAQVGDEPLEPPQELRVQFLGTGSARPSSARGSSALLAEWPSLTMLVDCGPGTLAQLRRLRVDVEAIDIIWISHAHLDHCGGLPAVLGARRGMSNLQVANALRHGRPVVRTKQLKVLAPQRVLDFAKTRGIALTGAIQHHDSLTSIRVNHCRDAYALVARCDGQTLAYSGDCRPSDAFADRARGATLLVHEATFADDRRDDAVAKRHCTVSEALAVARKVDPDATVLTHFSQRYVALPDVACLAAFDGLVVSASTAHDLAAKSRTFEKALADRPKKRKRDVEFPFDDVKAGVVKKPPCALYRRLQAFYEAHAPNKLADIASLVPLFERNFDVMDAKLQAKYGAGLAEEVKDDESSCSSNPSS